MSFLKNRSNYYITGSKIFAILATVFFILCVIFNISRVRTQAECPPKGTQLPAPSQADANEDKRGALRIAKVFTGQPQSDGASEPNEDIAIGQPVCVVVAGVAPASSLLDDREKARQDLVAAEKYDADVTVTSTTAAANAAGAQAKADASQRDNSPTAKDDLRVAEAAAGEAKAKSYLKDEADKDVLDTRHKMDAAEAAINGQQPIDLTPFLDGRRAPQASVKALPTPAPQAIPFDFGTPTDASTTVAAFWRSALVGARGGKKTFSLGLARKGLEVSEVLQGPAVTFRIYDWPTFSTGVAFIVSLIISIVLLASQTTLLRSNNSLFEDSDLDANQKHKMGRPNGPWSLGRAQMALWMVVVLAGFVFFWIALGEYQGVVTSSILILLGLNSATGLLAVQLDLIRITEQKQARHSSRILSTMEAAHNCNAFR